MSKVGKINVRSVLYMALFICLMMALSEVTAYAVERVVELDSGAARGSEPVMTDETFTSADGSDLRVTMSGLNDGNKAAMLECLHQHYSTGSDDPLKIMDESFVDAEKWDVYDDQRHYYYHDEEDSFYGYDAFQCWAGACSNLLWLSGWAKRVNDGGSYDPSTGKAFTSEDDIFDFYTSRFNDIGNDSDRAIDWFFMGQFFVNGIAPHADLIGGPLRTDGLFRSFVSSAAQKKYDLTKHPEEIRQIMRTASNLPGITAPRAVFQASVGNLNDNMLTSPLHSLTAAGLITDPAAAKAAAEDIKATGKTSVDPGDIYKAIILIDSDNDGEPTDEERAEKDALSLKSEKNKYKSAHRKTRPNSYTVYQLKYNKDRKGRNYWEIVYYYPDVVDKRTGETISDTCALYDIDALPLYDSALEQYFTETEGSTDLWTNVDLTMDTLYMTESTKSDPEPIDWDDDELKRNFEQGERLNLNYFLSNRSNVRLNALYPGGNEVTVDWKVIRDEDGETVAGGARTHAFKIHNGGGVEVGDIITLASAKETAKWETGAYTATLTYNRGREVKEAYYLNNIDRQVNFTIIKARKKNPMKASGKTVQISARGLRKKAKTIKRSRAIKVSSAKGKVTYDLKSVTKKKYKKYFAVNKKTSDITVKKGLGKGTYKLKIKVRASGTSEFKPSEVKSVTVTVKVDEANPLKVSGRTVKVKCSDLEKKNIKIARKKVLIVKQAKGKVTYKIVNVTPAKYKKYFSMNKKTGNVTVKKGLKTGTYKIKAAVTAAGNRKYKKKTNKAVFKVIVKPAEEKFPSYPMGLVDMYCAQTARDAFSDEDLEFFIDLIIQKLEPQAVEMLLDRFPCLRAAADQGQIGREIGLYIYYKKGDYDGKPEHETAEPAMMKLKDMAVVDGDDVKFKYMFAVDAGILCKLDEDQNPILDPRTGKFMMYREGDSIELFKDQLTGETMRALLLDYNRTGMIGATDIRNAVRNEEGQFPTQELADLYSKLVFPKWFTEGIVDSMEDVFRTDREQFKVLRSEENKDLLKNYVDSKNGFDLENNVLTRGTVPIVDSEELNRVSGYLAVLYLAELQLEQDGTSSIDESGVVSAERLLNGLNSILERMHNVETLDWVINDISPVDSGGKKIYNNTEEFEQKFIKGTKNEAGQYAGDEPSIHFVNTLIDYLEKEEDPLAGKLSGGSILTDLKEGSSPLDGSRDSYSDFLQIVERNELVESTVPNEVALAGGGRSSVD